MNLQAIFLLKRSAAALAFLLPMLLLSACETAPTPEELKSAHYGHYPSNYRSAARRILENRHDALGDPFNTVSISTPQKDFRGGVGSRTWGYTSEVVYNAPNPSVGANVYHYREKIFFHNSQVVEVSNATNVGDVMLSAVANNLTVAVSGDQGDGTDNADDGGGDDSTGTTDGTGHRHSSKRTASRTNRVAAARTNRRVANVQQQRRVAAPKTAPVNNKKKN